MLTRMAKNDKDSFENHQKLRTISLTITFFSFQCNFSKKKKQLSFNDQIVIKTNLFTSKCKSL